ncbi:hypothetical protein OF83DRAFT_1153052 [Amylostereum chailletii]|nr:hypothetical protein OF83DRAFT_1153052 [Amylostereum chailletii]
MLSRIRTMSGRAPLSKLVKRTRRNALPYLPPELLVLIFGQLRLIDPPKMAAKKALEQLLKDGEKIDLTQHFSDLGWIKIIHVCGLWRKAALNYTNLWTDIPNCDMPSQWIMFMLRQSLTTQISIAVDLSTYPLASAFNTINAIRQAIPRTRELTLDVYSASLFGPLQNARVLEALTLTGEDAILASSGFILPNKLPRALTSLALRGCFIPLTHTRFRTLRHLELATYIPIHMTRDHKLHLLWNADTMRRALDGMPDLKTLRLRNAFPTMSVYQDRNFQLLDPIGLPEGLERLELVGGTEDVQECLAGLVVPKKTVVDVVLDSVIVKGVNYDKALRRVCGAARKPRVVALQYGQEDMSYSFAVRMWDGREGQCLSDRADADVTVRLDAWAGLDGRVLRALAEASLEALCLDEVVEMRCDMGKTLYPDSISGREWEDYDWKPILTRARGVETICVSGRKALEGVMKALTKADDQSGDEESLDGAVVCPALTKLIVRDVEWAADAQKEKGKGPVELQKAVKECLKARKDAGLLVDVLEVSKVSGGDIRWLEDVKKLGVDVRVV